MLSVNYIKQTIAMKEFQLFCRKAQAEALTQIGTELYRIRNAMKWSKDLVALHAQTHPRTIARVESGVGVSFDKVNCISLLYLIQYSIEPQKLYKLTRLLATYPLMGQPKFVNKYDDSYFKNVIEYHRSSKIAHTMQITKVKR